MKIELINAKLRKESLQREYPNSKLEIHVHELE